MKISTKGEYYGAMELEEDFGDIFISEYQYNMPVTDWHYHENPYLMYVLQGDICDINKKQKRNCPSGSLIFHNWQEPHYNTKESREARGFHIEFERKWFTKGKLDIGLWEGTQIIENPNIHHLMAKVYAEFRFQDEFSELSVEHLLFEICEGIDLSASNKLNNRPPWVDNLIEILHHDNSNLSLDCLSKQLGVHPGHLSRAIPKYLSTTLGDYLRQQKVKKAINLMHNSQQSLQDVTYECGFSDQSHFIRTFKKYMGLTPKAYRSKIS